MADNIQNLIRPDPIKPYERSAITPEYTQGGLQGGQVQLGAMPKLPSKSAEQVQYENLAAIAGSLGQSINIFADLAEKIDKKTIQEVEAEFAKLDAEEDKDPRTQYTKFNNIVKNSSTFISGDTWKDTIMSHAHKRFGKEALNKFALEKYQEDALAYSPKYSGKLDDEIFNQEFLPKWMAENPTLEQVPSIALMSNNLLLMQESREQNTFLNTAIIAYKDNFEIPPAVLEAVGNGTLTIEEAEQQNLITSEAKLFYLEAQKGGSLLDLRASLNSRLFVSLYEDPAFARLSEPQIKEIVLNASKSLEQSVNQTWSLANTSRLRRMQMGRQTEFKTKFTVVQQNPEEATTENFRELITLSHGLPQERSELVGFIGTSLWERVLEESRGTPIEEDPLQQRRAWTKQISDTIDELDITPKEFGIQTKEGLIKFIESTATVGEGQNQIPLAKYFRSVQTFQLQRLSKDALSLADHTKATDPVPLLEGALYELFASVGGSNYIKPLEPKWGYRQDGTAKGSGYFGPLTTKNKDGQDEVVTEYSVTMGFGDHDTQVEIPTLVPTLTEEEIAQVLEAASKGENPPTSVLAKAAKHAQERMAAGLSPFANSEPVTSEEFVEVDTAMGDFVKLIYEDSDATTTREQLDQLRFKLSREGKLDEFEAYLKHNGYAVKLDLEFIRGLRELKNALWEKAADNLRDLESGNRATKSETSRFSVDRTVKELISNPEKLFGTAKARAEGKLNPKDSDTFVLEAALDTIDGNYRTYKYIATNESLYRDADKFATKLGVDKSDVFVLGEAQLIPLSLDESDKWGKRLEYIQEKLGVDRERAFDLAMEYNSEWHRRFFAVNGGQNADSVNFMEVYVKTDGFKPDSILSLVTRAYKENNTSEVTSLLTALEYHFNMAFVAGVPSSDPQIAGFHKAFGSWLRLESLGQVFTQAGVSPENRAQGALTMAILRSTTRSANAMSFWGDASQVDSQFMTILGEVLRASPATYDPSFISNEVQLATKRLVSAGQTTANTTMANVPDRLKTIILGPPIPGKLVSGVTHGQITTAVLNELASGRNPQILPYLLTGNQDTFKYGGSTSAEVEITNANLKLISDFLASGSGQMDPRNPNIELSVADFFEIPTITTDTGYNGVTGLSGQIKAMQDALGQPGFQMLIRGLVAFGFPSDTTGTGTMKEIETGRAIMIKTLARLDFHRNTSRKFSTQFTQDGRISFVGDDESRLPNATAGRNSFQDHFNGVSFTGISNASPTGVPFITALPDDPLIQETNVGRGYEFVFSEVFSGTHGKLFSKEVYTPKTASEFDEQFDRELSFYRGNDENIGPYNDDALTKELQPPIATRITPEQSLSLSALSLPISAPSFEYVMGLMPDLPTLKGKDYPPPVPETPPLLEQTNLVMREEKEENTIPPMLRRRGDGRKSAIEIFLDESKNNPEDESVYDFIRWYDRKYNTQLQADVLGYAFDPEIKQTVSTDIRTGDHLLQTARQQIVPGSSSPVWVRIPERDINLGNLELPTITSERQRSQRSNLNNPVAVQQRAMYQRVFLQAARYQFLSLQQKKGGMLR